jgi:hypothetical protein
MIPQTKGIEYLVAHFCALLCDGYPSSAKLPRRPEKVERWELRAALSIVLEQMRIEFASFGSTCDPELRKQLDVAMDEALTRIEAAADRI